MQPTVWIRIFFWRPILYIYVFFLKIVPLYTISIQMQVMMVFAARKYWSNKALFYYLSLSSRFKPLVPSFKKLFFLWLKMVYLSNNLVPIKIQNSWVYWMPNPSASTKKIGYVQIIWLHSIFFECGQIFLNMLKYANL